MKMSLIKIVLLCTLNVCLCIAGTRDEIPDFEFDDNFDAAHPPQLQRESAFSFVDFDEFFVDAHEPEFDIATKEKTIHRALFKALAAKELKYKFSEVIPLLRALSKSQRMVFASIISAQINGGKSLTLDEVKRMFGEEQMKPLLLPIVYDLANLVREGFLKSDKYQEHEKHDTNQFLRRSFEVEEPAAEKATQEVDFSAPSNAMRDDSLIVDEDDEPRTKEINESIDDIKPEPLMMVLNASVTAKTPLAITLQRSQPGRNLSLEEIEDLAFAGINGTLEDSITDTNGSLISPMPLIGRYRKKGSPPQFKPETCERFTGGICLNVKNYPMNEIMGSIRRHRYAMEALLAEFRDKTAELEQLDYLGDPTADLTDLRRRQDSEASSPGSMCNSIIRYARPQKARSATGEWKFIVNTGEHTQTLRLEKCSNPLEPCSYLTENFESSCTQVYNYHRLLSWDNTRGLHVDIFKVPTCCSCHLVGYKEAFPPLASPSNSITNVSKKKQPQDFDAFSSSSNRNSQYSTLNESDDFETNNDEDSNIAYQFGNGFKRLKPRKPDQQQQQPEIVENTRNRQPTKRNQFPESFLTPPANNPEANFPFTNRGPNNRQRTPTLKRKQFDQQAGESDLKISRVTVFPPKVFSQSERPRRVTPPIASTIDTNSVNLRLANAQSADTKRVNYNYHPIIDFFEEEEPKRPSLDRKTGKLKAEDSWRPVIGG